MRALIIISASLAIVIEPSSTWLTNSFTRSLPRSLASPNRPCSTIWSSRLDSCASTAPADVAAAFAAASGIGTSWADLALQLVQLLGITYRLEQQLFQLVVALQGAAQVRKSGAQIEKLFQRLNLFSDICRLKIIKFAEF